MASAGVFPCITLCMAWSICTEDAAPIPVTDDEEEPADEVVSNWNVPSWDELIASLYRPDR